MKNNIMYQMQVRRESNLEIIPVVATSEEVAIDILMSRGIKRAYIIGATVGY